MKRLIAAVSFAVLATPALADSKPYEQLDVDRALPQISVERTQAAEAVDSRSTAASAGATGVSQKADGAWANDHNFIAPAQ
jgi:hypothetical protein